MKEFVFKPGKLAAKYRRERTDNTDKTPGDGGFVSSVASHPQVAANEHALVDIPTDVRQALTEDELKNLREALQVFPAAGPITFESSLQEKETWLGKIQGGTLDE